MVVSGGLRHGVDDPAARVVDGRAGDAERVDVPARQLGQRHRGADVRPPEDLAGRLVERVDGVVLGRRDHHAADKQRLAVDGAVEVRPPAHPQRAGRGDGGGDARTGEVVPVRGPVGAGMSRAGRLRSSPGTEASSRSTSRLTGIAPGRTGAARRGGQHAAGERRRREPGRPRESHPISLPTRPGALPPVLDGIIEGMPESNVGPGLDAFVAIGDSFTEGLHDPDPGGGFRGWADRVADALSAQRPGFRYANLAIRGKLLGQVVAEQLPRAVEMAPDLVSLAAGGNDILCGADVDALAAEFESAVAKLLAAGCRWSSSPVSIRVCSR